MRLLDPGDAQFARPQFLVQFSVIAPVAACGDPLPMLARLTPAQREVALRAAQGLDNDEIAGQLAISRSTVRTHLRQVFKALGIGSRGKLVPLARAWGRGDAPADDQKPAGR